MCYIQRLWNSKTFSQTHQEDRRLQKHNSNRVGLSVHTRDCILIHNHQNAFNLNGFLYFVIYRCTLLLYTHKKCIILVIHIFFLVNFIINTNRGERFFRRIILGWTLFSCNILLNVVGNFLSLNLFAGNE
jgi:hypothetical protein